jgi:hypothetical protein
MLGSQCQGNLVQHTSIREVVVWVNENGQRIDPNAVDQSHIEEAPAPQKNVSISRERQGRESDVI